MWTADDVMHVTRSRTSHPKLTPGNSARRGYPEPAQVEGIV